MRFSLPLRVFGHISDLLYWQNLQDNYNFDLVDYRGFLPTESLQKELGDCFGLLMTPRWVEAFGNGAIEALACGVPVVAYRRGGPVEIIEDGKTGFLVEPDSIEGLVTGIKNLGSSLLVMVRQGGINRLNPYLARDLIDQFALDKNN